MYRHIDLSYATKEQLVTLGVNIAKKFCEVNGVPLPKLKIDRNCKAPHRGEYHNKVMPTGRVDIWLRNCVTPCRAETGRNWNYPAYKTDVTPLGVIAHEIGHHIGYAEGIWDVPGPRNLVSSYEPNGQERVAESIRLFILNPDLLKALAPERYAFLLAKGLTPIISETWQEVLRSAPNRLTQNIIKKSW